MSQPFYCTLFCSKLQAFCHKNPQKIFHKLSELFFRLFVHFVYSDICAYIGYNIRQKKILHEFQRTGDPQTKFRTSNGCAIRSVAKQPPTGCPLITNKEENSDMRQLTVNQNDAGQRLDKFLIKFLPAMPQSLVYKSLRKKRVKVNGKRAHERDILRTGDVLELYINDEFFDTPAPEEAFMKIRTPSVRVVYEDENILLADKPQGLVVHSDDKESINTLISHIQAYLYQKGEYDPKAEHSFAPALCNRIDRNTRGIVIAAKNAESLRILNEKIKTKEVRKFYLCLVCGIPQISSDTLTSYMKKDSAANLVTVHRHPTEGAKTAITKYRVIKTYRKHALLEIELITGRTHQIRAQMSAIGHPLLGDGKYGTWGKNPLLKQQALCSYRLCFDFTDDAGILNYLSGKEFSISPVDFGVPPEKL